MKVIKMAKTAKKKVKEQDKSYKYIVSASTKLGMKFKAWTAGEGMSINRGLNLLMRYAANGDFDYKEMLKKAKKAKKAKA
jgi:hypothetical protein